MARRQRRQTRRQRRQRQRGGAWSYTGPAFMSAAGAPVESRTSISDCGEGPRPVPTVVPRGAMVGGGCGCMAAPPMQAGGGSGTGGYGFVLNNDLGKVYADLAKGSCALPQRGAGRRRSHKQRGGDAVVRAIDSYPAGYGFGAASVNEIGDGTAHFLAPLPYGRQCMGGGRRQRQRSQRQRQRQQKRKQSQRRH